MQEFDIMPFFESVEFIAIAVIVIILAYIALEHSDIVYAAFAFGFMASLVAGFFLLLEAPFIAGMQIAVYTGGISVLMIFAVLLLPRAQDRTLEAFPTPSQRRAGLVISTAFVVYSGLLAFLFPWADTFPEESVPIAQNLGDLAAWLWGAHGIYVQMIGLILVCALVGSVAILKMEKAERLKPLTAEFGIEVADLSADDEAPPEVRDETEEEGDSE